MCVCVCARCCRSLGVWTVLAGWVLAAGLTAPGWTLCSKDRQGCWLLCGPHAETFERMASLITAGLASHKPRQRQITHIFTKCKLPSVLLPSFAVTACGLHFVFVCIQDWPLQIFEAGAASKSFLQSNYLACSCSTDIPTIQLTPVGIKVFF